MDTLLFTVIDDNSVWGSAISTDWNLGVSVYGQ
jgi:hypothetical protein